MNVQCTSCKTVFRRGPAQGPSGVVRARCSICRAVFDVAAPPLGVVDAQPAPPPIRRRPPAAAPAAAPAPSEATPAPPHRPGTRQRPRRPRHPLLRRADRVRSRAAAGARACARSGFGTRAGSGTRTGSAACPLALRRAGPGVEGTAAGARADLRHRRPTFPSGATSRWPRERCAASSPTRSRRAGRSTLRRWGRTWRRRPPTSARR